MKNFLMLLLVSMTLSACCHMGKHHSSCGCKDGAKGECPVDKKSDCCGDTTKTEVKK